MAERALTLARTYKVAEIAARFGVTVKKVYGWIHDGRLVALHLPGRNGNVIVRVRREELDDFERQWLGRSSESQTTDFEDEAGSGASAGLTQRPADLSAFRRGRQTRRTP